MSLARSKRMTYRLPMRMFWPAVAAALLTACGSVAVEDHAASTSGPGGSSGTTAASSGSGDTGGSAATSTSTGAVGEPCGMNGPCAPGLHCLFADHGCGKTPGPCSSGYCAAPGSCELGGPPACGCDGTVYDNACLANAAGVGTSSIGGCGSAPQGRFACGNLFCNEATQICIDKPVDGCGYVEHECRDVPPECGKAYCGCIDFSAECVDGVSCKVSPQGDVTVVCTNF